MGARNKANGWHEKKSSEEKKHIDINLHICTPTSCNARRPRENRPFFPSLVPASPTQKQGPSGKIYNICINKNTHESPVSNVGTHTGHGLFDHGSHSWRNLERRRMNIYARTSFLSFPSSFLGFLLQYCSDHTDGHGDNATLNLHGDSGVASGCRGGLRGSRGT